MHTIEELTQAVIEFRDKRNWEEWHTPKNCAIGITAEASEVAELFLWKRDKELEAPSSEWIEDLGDELSDVLYWVLLIAHKYDIDLADAFPAKLEKTAKKYPII